MRILAIDPGTEESAWLVYDTVTEKPVTFGISHNNDLRLSMIGWRRQLMPMDALTTPSHLAIEMIASYGMSVGREVFETCLWIGRFIEAAQMPHTLVYRKEVKLHLCASPRANDGNIRAALIDRWGGKDKAIGSKKSPGPLHGISSHTWQALAVAVQYADTHHPEEERLAA